MRAIVKSHMLCLIFNKDSELLLLLPHTACAISDSIMRKRCGCDPAAGSSHDKKENRNSVQCSEQGTVLRSRM